jgi:hypothetical protein
MLITTVAARLPVLACLGLTAQPCLEMAIICLNEFHYTVHIYTSLLETLAGMEAGT